MPITKVSGEPPYERVVEWFNAWGGDGAVAQNGEAKRRKTGVAEPAGRILVLECRKVLAVGGAQKLCHEHAKAGNRSREYPPDHGLNRSAC
jgi:hypothetical protein